MQRELLIGVMATTLICSTAAGALAADTASSATASGQSAATSPASPAAPAAIIATVVGSIAALDLTAVPPSMTLTTKAGTTQTLPLTPAQVMVWRNDQHSSVEQLKIGDVVKVRVETKEGKQIVRSIRVEPAPQTSAASATPKPSTP